MAAVLVVIDDPSMAQPIPLLRDIGLRRACRASATTFVRESVNVASPSQPC